MIPCIWSTVLLLTATMDQTTTNKYSDNAMKVPRSIYIQFSADIFVYHFYSIVDIRQMQMMFCLLCCCCFSYLWFEDWLQKLSSMISTHIITQLSISWVNLANPAWLWDSQSRMVSTMGMEKSRKIDYSHGKWSTRGTKTAKSVLPVGSISSSHSKFSAICWCHFLVWVLIPIDGAAIDGDMLSIVLRTFLARSS